MTLTEEERAHAERVIAALPEPLRPIARWVDTQFERGGIVGRNAATGEPVTESAGEYMGAWALIRDLEQVLKHLAASIEKETRENRRMLQDIDALLDQNGSLIRRLGDSL